jgi:diguanylate cyclase (GGDEF)-like protein
LINDTTGILALFILACSPFLVLGGHYLPNVWWGPYLRIMLPMLILQIGAFVVGDAIGSLALITLFPILAVAYLHAPKIAIPYCFLGTAMTMGALYMFDNVPRASARVVVVGGVLTTIVVGLVYAQHRLRTVAALNQRLSTTDPLTGLANLRRLQTRLRNLIQRATRTGDTIVLFAIDLDDFKQVNDRFSYELGDRVLKAVARSLSAEMAPGDLLVRRGGDEFAVLMLARPDRNIVEYGECLNDAIISARTAVCPEVNPHASVTHVCHVFGETLEDFLRRVDDGLHEAKLDAHPERRAEEIATGRERAEATHVFSAGLDEDPVPTMAESMGVRRSRLEQDARIGWRMTAGAIVTAPILLIAVSAAGLAPDLRAGVVSIAVVGMLVCALFAGLASPRRITLRLMHIPLAISLGLITLAVNAAGDSQQALLELYAISTPLVIYFLGARQAAPYGAFSASAYTYFLLASDYSHAFIRVTIFVGALALLCVMLERGQRMTAAFSERAAMLSIIDPLTGVSNLRGFHRRVADEINRCRTIGAQLALVAIDLDGFKLVNDKHSHTMGDAVLVETAKAISAVVREDELVARRGGDEFAIVCAPEAHADMDAFVERIAESIETARLLLTPDVPSSATVSYVFWNPDEDAAEFMRRADVELHDAKAAIHAVSPIRLV